MIEYAIHFYSHYTFIFYILLLISVILEGPITILTLSLFAYKVKLNFCIIFFFAFIGDFFGDITHYVIGRFFKNYILKKDILVLRKLDEKLKGHKLIDKLIFIKYTPPFTSIGLLYLGFSKLNFKKFIKNDIILCIFSSVLITSIGYNVGYLFKDKNNFGYLIISLFIAFMLFYFLLKVFTQYLIKKLYE